MFSLNPTSLDRAMSLRLLTVSILAPRYTPGELIATFSPTTIGRWLTYNGPPRWNTQHTMMLGCTATEEAGATWTHWAPLTPPEGKP